MRRNHRPRHAGGRPPGPTIITKDLAERVQLVLPAVEGDLLTALATVADDGNAPLDTRLAALRRLSGALFGQFIMKNLGAVGSTAKGGA